jgi:hypothetical protein
MAAYDTEERYGAWVQGFPGQIFRATDEFGGMFNNRTFPKKNLWRGDGFVAIRVGMDVFAVRVIRPEKQPRVGTEVELRRYRTWIRCKVVRLTITDTEEVKSKNCGLMVLQLLSTNTRQTQVVLAKEESSERQSLVDEQTHRGRFEKSGSERRWTQSRGEVRGWGR